MWSTVPVKCFYTFYTGYVSYVIPSFVYWAAHFFFFLFFFFFFLESIKLT